MSSFFTDLIQSIFIPGPTSSLLLATNVTFAALQLTLLAVLIGTYNVHFFALSCISAGLWWAINWFVAELNAVKAAQAAEAEEDRKEKEKEKKTAAAADGDGDHSEGETIVDNADDDEDGQGASGSREVEVREMRGEVRRRTDMEASRLSDVSTEDEWEKVSQQENEKDK